MGKVVIPIEKLMETINKLGEREALTFGGFVFIDKKDDKAFIWADYVQKVDKKPEGMDAPEYLENKEGR